MIALVFAATSAQAEEAAVAVDFPPQALSASLERLAKAAGLQLLYSSEVLAGKQAARLSGNYPPRQALDRLLQNSGLAFHFTDSRTVVIRPVGATPAPPRTTLDTIVVTATKTERNASEVPATVAVVEAAQIENMYSRDSSDLLTRSAGLDIARSGSSGISTLNIRGTGSRRSSVLVNGQYAEFLDLGIGNQSTLQTIDWDDVERLEVVRGAGSALYGPNAMGGVVNVITKAAPAEKNVTRPFFVFDSLPTYGGGVSSGGTLDDFTYLFNFKHLNSDGYKSAPKPGFFPGYTMTTTHSLQSGAWDRTMLGGRLGYKATSQDQLNFAFNYMDQSSLAFDRVHTPQSGAYGQYSLDFKHAFSDRFDVTATLSHRSHVADLTWDNYLYPFTTTGIHPDSTLYEDAQKLAGDIRGRWTPVDGHTLLFGYNAAQDWTKVRNVAWPTGAETSKRRADVINHGLYLQYELELSKRLFASMGGRYDWFDYDMGTHVVMPADTVRNNRSAFETFNPRGGLRYKFNDFVAVHGSIGTGFRAPDPGSMVGGASSAFFVSLPNTSLRPETSDSYDLGLDFDMPFGMHAAVTGFYNDISNYISLSRYQVGGQTILQSKNLAKVQTYGAELELTQKLTQQFSLFTNYTHTIARTAANLDATTLGLPQNGYQLPNVPEHKAAFGVLFESSRVNGRLEGRYVGKQFISGDSSNQEAFALPSYVVADINATYRHPLGNQKTLDITAGVNNLFDRRYAMRSNGIYNEPRVGFIRLGLEF
jgi:outer membrane receptor protein involved in Fe transport